MTILFVVIWKLLKLFRPSVGRYNLDMEPKCSWSSYNYSNKVTLDIECFLCLSSFQKVKCKWENIYPNKHLQVGIVSPKHFKETFWVQKVNYTRQLRQETLLCQQPASAFSGTAYVLKLYYWPVQLHTCGF